MQKKKNAKLWQNDLKKKIGYVLNKKNTCDLMFLFYFFMYIPDTEITFLLPVRKLQNSDNGGVITKIIGNHTGDHIIQLFRLKR